MYFYKPQNRPENMFINTFIEIKEKDQKGRKVAGLTGSFQE